MCRLGCDPGYFRGGLSAEDDLFGVRPFDRGMEASESASTKWTEEQVAAVDGAIRRLAAAGVPFTTDDVWRLIPDVPVTKGMSSRLNGLVKRQVIKNTGRLTVSARGGDHDHAQRLAIWIGYDADGADRVGA